jgi:hypothetical protein
MSPVLPRQTNATRGSSCTGVAPGLHRLMLIGPGEPPVNSVSTSRASTTSVPRNTLLLAHSRPSPDLIRPTGWSATCGGMRALPPDLTIQPDRSPGPCRASEARSDSIGVRIPEFYGRGVDQICGDSWSGNVSGLDTESRGWHGDNGGDPVVLSAGRTADCTGTMALALVGLDRGRCPRQFSEKSRTARGSWLATMLE